MKPLIVGSGSDLHVKAVVEAVAAAGGPEPILADPPLLQEEGFCVTEAAVRVGGTTVSRIAPGRGWLRRYAAAQWGLGIQSGTLDAAVHRAFLTLVGAITRMDNWEWLTDVGAMLGAEDRCTNRHRRVDRHRRAPDRCREYVSGCRRSAR